MHTSDGLDLLFARYITRLERKGDVPQTIANNLVTFRKAQAWFDAAGVRPDQATSADLEDLFDCLRQAHAPSTLRGHLSRLRAAYAYALRHGLVSCDPTQDVLLPKMPDIEPETYTNEELRRILTQVRDDSEEAIVHLLIYAGLRRHEVIGLEWKDVEFDRPADEGSWEGRKASSRPASSGAAGRTRRASSGQPSCGHLGVEGACERIHVQPETPRPAGASTGRRRTETGTQIPKDARDVALRERRPGTGDRPHFRMGSNHSSRPPLHTCGRHPHATGNPRCLRRRSPFGTAPPAGGTPADA